jgi:hypothetical protein
VAPIPPALVTAPVVSGSTRDGAALSSTAAVFNGTVPQVAYRWRRCEAELGTGGVPAGCADIPGAASSAYRLTAADVGHRLVLVATATNAAGSASGISDPTGSVLAAPPAALSSPGVAGTPVTGRSLAAAAVSFAGTAPIAYAYQWSRCDGSGSACADVPGATGAAYPIGAADLGRTLRVRVSATNAAGTTAAISGRSGVVLLAIDAGHVRSALGAALMPARRAATVRAVLRARGASTSFDDRFGAGVALVSWYGKSRGRSVLVAKARRQLGGNARAAMKLSLTSAGRSLLRKARRSVKLTGKASFTPAGQAAIATSRAVSLRLR